MQHPIVPSMTEPEITNLVREFNTLPRRHTAPSGLVPNKWIFGLHVVPIPPSGYLLFILNPGSQMIHGEGPLPIETRPLNTAERKDRARKVAILLLKAFVSKLGMPDAPFKFAPWEWVCEDTQLASAVAEALRALGVRNELCTVGVATDQEKNLAAERFAEFLESLVRTMRAAGASA